MADQKITQLNENTAPAASDLLVIVDDPSGSPESQKITVANLFSGSTGIIPSARVYNNADLTISNNTVTAATFNAERWDTNAIHDTVSNTDRLTCKTAGIYAISAVIDWDADNTGVRFIAFDLNGTTYIHQKRVQAVQAFPTEMDAYTQYDLSVDDYIRCLVFQNSGGDLNIGYNPNGSPEFMMTRIG